MKLKAVYIVLVSVIVLLFLRDLVDGCGSSSRRDGGQGGCKPRDCKWGSWSSWSECIDSCGSLGMKTHSRYKTETESCGGKCSGKPSESIPCNKNACKNGGTPTDHRCHCTTGWTGDCCESGKKVFVLRMKKFENP